MCALCTQSNRERIVQYILWLGKYYIKASVMSSEREKLKRKREPHYVSTNVEMECSCSLIHQFIHDSIIHFATEQKQSVVPAWNRNTRLRSCRFCSTQYFIHFE